MTPYYADSLVTLLNSDVREALASLPEASVHAVVTSPPYWALRDYKVDGQIGMEPTIEEYVAHMVEVFRGVRRVLRDDGMMFLNLGDSYAGSGKSSGNEEMMGGEKQRTSVGSLVTMRTPLAGLKPLDLCNIPHRVAQALQADGWYWRQTWHWIKRSPMPESVSGTRWQRCRVKVANGEVPRMGDPSDSGERSFTRDHGKMERIGLAQWAACPGCPRCTYPERPERNGWVLRRGSWRYTDAVEYVFLMAKAPGYTAFQEQVREEAATPFHSTGGWRNGNTDNNVGGTEYFDPSLASTGRNPRNWALLSSEPQSLAHFATYPTALVEPFIRAATSDKGVCATCGAQWVPVVEHKAMVIDRSDYAEESGNRTAASGNMVEPAESTVLDYWPSCACPATPPVPATVLDPFSGSGTTCLAARTLGRRSIGIDLSSDYMDIAVTRLGDGRKAQIEMSL